MDDTKSQATLPRFVLDASMIKLGKYLRCAGYDAQWDARATAREAAKRACDTERVFVTRSTRVAFEFPRPPRCVELVATDPVAQFRELASVLELDLVRFVFTRCIRCNVDLDAVAEPENVRSRVIPEVFERHRHFFTCPRCGTVFWHGSHVANTCRKLGLALPERGSTGAVDQRR
ncbi:MAG: Mut7-C RNAse domain-containing protein [Planctomycetes bacterium]|nr:Mut7-C RNAse domain-containing protein [Planctomycetota bacterium]